jgi:hypothetical protein
VVSTLAKSPLFSAHREAAKIGRREILPKHRMSKPEEYFSLLVGVLVS